MSAPVICVDFGSTFTKALLIDVDDGTVLAGAEHRTTVSSDVLEGWWACRAELAQRHPVAGTAQVLGCSSAGGGLRVGVVGNEDLVTAEAGRRVALSSGGRVVYAAGGGLDQRKLAALRAALVDVVLLVGGTDGGHQRTLLEAAEALARTRWPGPVVVAGNADAAPRVHQLLAVAGVTHIVADNVVPAIGVLRPVSARAAIRTTFLEHVIGGKGLSGSRDFVAMLAGPTPDLVLDGVELLAEQVGDVAVVDVGGATTDVHSVVEIDPEDTVLARQVVAPTRVTRTVEADLGMRWSAPSTIAAAVELGLVDAETARRLAPDLDRLQGEPGRLPRTAGEHELDARLATCAIGVALRRHAGRQQVRFGPDGRVVERTGKDLRDLDLLVGSGGVLRHRADAVHVVRRCTGEVAGGWLTPRAPDVVIDTTYVLAAAGLLRRRWDTAARELVRRYVAGHDDASRRVGSTSGERSA